MNQYRTKVADITEMVKKRPPDTASPSTKSMFPSYIELQKGGNTATGTSPSVTRTTTDLIQSKICPDRTVNKPEYGEIF